VGDSNYTSIPIGMGVCGVIFMGQQHDIGAFFRVNRVLITSEIVCCIIEADSLVMIDSVLCEVHAASVLWCELVFITLVGGPSNATKEVIFKIGNKILEVAMSVTITSHLRYLL